MYRKMVASGEFYPNDPHDLENFINKYRFNGVKTNFITTLVPVCRYGNSGEIGVNTLTRLNLPDTVILTGVNHSGFGETISVWKEGSWETPLGDVAIDEKIAKEIINASTAKDDILAHVREYSIETVVPILKYIKPDIKIVPISFMGMPLAKLRAFGSDLSKFIGRNGSSGLIICGDLDRSENLQVVDRNDKLLIDAILSIDGEAIYEIVMEEGANMEGVYPATACLMATYLAGGSKGSAASYAPGYAGIILE